MQWVGIPTMVAAGKCESLNPTLQSMIAYTPFLLVSNAGGLGILTGLTQPNPEALRLAIREVRKLTSKPLLVHRKQEVKRIETNLFLMHQRCQFNFFT